MSLDSQVDQGSHEEISTGVQKVRDIYTGLRESLWMRSHEFVDGWMSPFQHVDECGRTLWHEMARIMSNGTHATRLLQHNTSSQIWHRGLVRVFSAFGQAHDLVVVELVQERQKLNRQTETKVGLKRMNKNKHTKHI